MHGHGMRKKKKKPKPTLAELNKMAFLKIRKARKPPPFLSSLDRGVNRKMLRAMWEEEIINDLTTRLSFGVWTRKNERRQQ